MKISPFDELSQLGLNQEQWQGHLARGSGCPLARVARVDRGLCFVVSSVSQARAPSEQQMRVRVPPSQSVVVGDWVELLAAEGEQLPTIRERLPRATYLERRAVSGRGDQGIAANIDVVFVVAAFAQTPKLNDRALNPRRLERYVAAILSGGASPVIVLNKADLVAQSVRDQVGAELRQRLQCDVACVSAVGESGLHALEAYLKKGATLALVGLSGVGKSTLTNLLLGEERQDVTATRDVDSKGRHTTTRRELTMTRGGVLIIDTPGMREMGVAGDSLAPEAFEDIGELSEACRFRDCKHNGEPGCAVGAAVAAGTLSQERLASRRTLELEAAAAAARAAQSVRQQPSRRPVGQKRSRGPRRRSRGAESDD